MKTLAFDGQMGASGDMLLGALVACGADPSVLAPVESTLDVTYRFESVTRAGIGATATTIVRMTDDGAVSLEGAGPNRTLTDVEDIVEEMPIPGTIRDRSLETFAILAEAEARVHDASVDDIHFHEVGADDAIADIVGAHLLIDDLAVERIVATPLATGSGTVTMAHGTYPIPGPAVVAILEETTLAIRGGPVEGELLTPTGASILATVADGVETIPTIHVTTAGYGAGSTDYSTHANVLRALVGETSGGLRKEPIAVLETNLDDATPEVLGGLQERLHSVGALDVSIIPVTMKKSRPGHLVQVIVRPEDVERVADRLARETGTLGIRQGRAGHRWVADRDEVTVSIDIDGESYSVAVKVASDRDGECFDVSAEYDDAAAVAVETDRPVRDILRLAEATARNDLESSE